MVVAEPGSQYAARRLVNAYVRARLEGTGQNWPVNEI